MGVKEKVFLPSILLTSFTPITIRLRAKPLLFPTLKVKDSLW